MKLTDEEIQEVKDSLDNPTYRLKSMRNAMGELQEALAWLTDAEFIELYKKLIDENADSIIEEQDLTLRKKQWLRIKV